MESSDFLKSLMAALGKAGKITRLEKDQAVDLINSHYYSSNLTQQGPCLRCLNVDLDYVLSGVHKQQGDIFLEKVTEKFKAGPPEIKAEYNPLRLKDDFWQNTKINGWKKANVWGYLCETCQDDLMAIMIKVWNAQANQKQSIVERKLTDAHDIVGGKVQASIGQRFRALRLVFTSDNVEILKGMQYSDFLQTTYWSIVSKYKKSQVDYKCEMCNSGNVLNTHHKTYEHHGQEHLYLDDLVVLCRNCHQKFHDKVVY